MASPEEILEEAGSKAGIAANRLGAQANTLAKRQLQAAREGLTSFLAPRGNTAGQAAATATQTAQTGAAAIRTFRRAATAARTVAQGVGAIIAGGPVVWIIAGILFLLLLSVFGLFFAILGGNPNSESLKANCEEMQTGTADCNDLGVLVDSVCKKRIEQDKQKVTDDKSRITTLEECLEDLRSKEIIPEET